jgi:hypothetical protein
LARPSGVPNAVKISSASIDVSSPSRYPPGT